MADCIYFAIFFAKRLFRGKNACIIRTIGQYFSCTIGQVFECLQNIHATAQKKDKKSQKLQQVFLDGFIFIYRTTKNTSVFLKKTTAPAQINKTGKFMRPQQYTKQKKNRAQNIENILTAAEIIFAQFGYNGASISRIAEEAGLPKSNVVYYFSTKELLYRTVVEDIFNVWRAAADEIVEDADPREALGSYIDTKMELARTRPYGSMVWANEIIQGAPIVQDYLETELRSWTEERVNVIHKWIAAGKIRPISPKHLLFTIWATTQHYADFKHQISTLNEGSDLNDEQWEETKQAVKELLLFGICH